MVDYNLLAPDDLTVMLKRPLEKVLSDNEIDKLEKIFYNYDYYSGKQHTDKMGRLVRAAELERPDGYAYDPARFETNYFKAFIKRKARWQMAGDHGIEVIPNDETESEIESAQAYEDVLNTLWEQNRMDAKKIALARDRLIGGSIACKLSFNPRNGQLHWIWHRAHEVFPLYSDDGFEELIGCDIILPHDDDVNEGRTLYYVQHFRLEEDALGEVEDCSLEEIVYNEEMKVVKTIQEKKPLGIDYVPVVMFDVEDVNGDDQYFDDLKDLEILTDQINTMMEDASDSLAFEMFGITVVKNAKEGTAQQLQIAPGAVVEINSAQEGVNADMSNLENGFQWKEAFKDQYNRVKSAAHELSGLPQIVPQELNFGGMNDRALQVLYQDIIQETEEHWLAWDVAFGELFEKSIGYLKARTHSKKFKYDKSTIINLDEKKTKMNFVLPLPDDREQLVDLVTKEVEGGFESIKGGQKRLGVVDTEKKLDEILDEKQRQRDLEDPYQGGSEIAAAQTMEPNEGGQAPGSPLEE